MSYYKDLEILPTASMEEISVAYNNIINKLDEDYTVSEEIRLDNRIKYNKVFATLSNYNSRRKYDNLMEESAKAITAYNSDNCYSYVSFNNTEDDEVLNTNEKDDNDNNNILNKIETLFLDLNVRLESIEKKIYNNEKMNNNFYKERKKINTKWTKGKKTVNIVTDLNNNGEMSRKVKTIGYDSDGNEEIKYKTINPNNLSKNV
jgi:DnaJ-class molecular chaperone